MRSFSVLFALLLCLSQANAQSHDYQVILDKLPKSTQVIFWDQVKFRQGGMTGARVSQIKQKLQPHAYRKVLTQLFTSEGCSENFRCENSKKGIFRECAPAQGYVCCLQWCHGNKDIANLSFGIALKLIDEKSKIQFYKSLVIRNGQIVRANIGGLKRKLSPRAFLKFSRSFFGMEPKELAKKIDSKGVFTR